jgi:outer membrane protein assembly factor BamB
VVAVALQWLMWAVLPGVMPEAGLALIVCGIFGGGLAILVWWLFFSRTTWSERIGIIVLMPIMVWATSRLVDPSIANAAMGQLLYILAIPALGLALVSGAVVSRWLPQPVRPAVLIAAILAGCGVFTVLRTGGMSGNGDSDFHWRWTKTPEERLLALADTEPLAGESIPPVVENGTRWPGFRGPQRDGIVRGVQIATDWSRWPPVELWRRSIGPGWSSFAVAGDRFYTQEQRGDEEMVACYHLATGQPVWMHPDAVRFWESNAGAGPRATPTLCKGRVYSLGATGIVNALDAADGALVWSSDAVSDTGAKVPTWGFSGSPLVVDDLVIVAASGRLVAYDLATGKLRWSSRASAVGYSSPHLATLDGVKQVLLLHGEGALSVAPTTGKELWTYAWDSDGIVQPALTVDGALLIGSGSGMGGSETGVRRVAVRQGRDGWSTSASWSSVGLKPTFNDFVVHAGHAYGFDGALLACIDLADGKRRWKGGRFGHGQLILLADQSVLLVLSEKGELALVAATPEQFQELARFPAIAGKSWNHPVLAGDVLLVRNDQEMAAFRLALAEP